MTEPASNDPADGGVDSPSSSRPEPAGSRNPFRSEADAFRLLLLIGGGVTAIVAAFVIGGAWLGVPVLLVLGAISLRATYRWIAAGISEPDEKRD